MPNGAYVFEDDLRVAGVLAAKVITCTAWLLELYLLRAGDLYFISDNQRLRAKTKRFGVLYPPFSITQACFQNARAHVIGLAATDDLPTSIRNAPIVFDTAVTGMPSSIAEAVGLVSNGRNPQSIPLNPRPSLLSLKAKRLIDENYHGNPSIARVATRLGVSHEHLSRQFKYDFSMTPSAYLHQLRVADETLKLARGETIINVSHDVGYNDLSRFYKQFRKTTKTSPGVCRTMLKT